MSARDILRDLLPPLLLRRWRNMRGGTIRFSRQPAGWDAAVAASGGYDEASILDRVVAATEQVIDGRALFERDSVVFHEPEYPFALLAAILDAALRNGGDLDLLDFGGSLGSKYWQCRPMLTGVRRLRWCVVEQTHFVRVGQDRFTNEQLSFAASLAELPFGGPPQVALASSVLQYLPDPHAVLEALTATGATTLVIDRTPVCDRDADAVCVQHVPKSIYPASYPCWILSRAALLRRLEAHWNLACEFDCPEGRLVTDDGLPFDFRGFILQRKA